MVLNHPTQERSQASSDGHFPATRWSLVRAALFEDDQLARRSLGELLQSYWQPLYIFVRRSGLSHEDASDAVQSFWEMILKRGSLQSADPAQGKLRTFLLAALQNHLKADYRKRRAGKRGGGAESFSLDAMEGMTETLGLPHHPPVEEFDQRWAYTLLENTRQRLRKEYEKRLRGDLFELLEPALAWNGADVCYQTLAEALRMTEAAIQQAVKRMRLRYKKLLEDEILQTLEDESQLQEEKNHLIRVLSSC
jgi:DNA-directed RNA polymerase specialized sigma24 family protein